MSRRPVVFLDRDGVIVGATVRDGKPYPPPSLEQMRIVTGARAALLDLKAAGFLIIVITNQPDVARGVQNRTEVERMHAALRKELPIDDVFACYHDDQDACYCRKPSPGLLLEACARYDIDLGSSFLVGDRWRDMDAGHAAGCLTVLIEQGYVERGPLHPPTVRVTCLREAVAWICGQSTSGGTEMANLDLLKVKIFADGAEKSTMLDLYANPLIQGFTTNPTLMRKAGVTNYEEFARDILNAIPDRPISFEVFADEFDDMQEQARHIATWGKNVYVKIPVTNTRRESSCPLVRELSQDGVKLNVTALLTLDQVRRVAAALDGGAPAYISVFAGRIADTGRDPLTVMKPAMSLVSASRNIEMIWASPRELLNVFQADAIGCHVITATNDIVKKLNLIGKDLDEYSLETVAMFRDDALKANFTIDTSVADAMAASV